MTITPYPRGSRRCLSWCPIVQALHEPLGVVDLDEYGDVLSEPPTSSQTRLVDDLRWGDSYDEVGCLQGSAAGHVRRRQPPIGPQGTRHLLSLRTDDRDTRRVPSFEGGQALGTRDPRLPHDRPHQREGRGPEPDYRESAATLWVPKMSSGPFEQGL